MTYNTKKVAFLVEERVITLYDVLTMINEDRRKVGKKKLEHGKQMTKVAELAKHHGFGTVDKIAVVYNDKGQMIETYNLTKKQAMAVGAKLDDKRLMIVINQLEGIIAQTQPKSLANTELALMVIEAEEKLEMMAKK